MHTEFLTPTEAAHLAGISTLRLLWLAWRRRVAHWRLPGGLRQPLCWRFSPEDLGGL